MKKLIIRRICLLTLMSVLAACGSDNSSKAPVSVPPPTDGTTDIVDPVDPAVPVEEVEVIELTNGGFESDPAGETSATGNWAFSTNNEGAVATVQISESEEGINSYKGSKAVEILVSALGAQPWNVEVTYEDIPVEGGKSYEFSVWVKGAVGTSADFWIQTPAPDYGQRALSKEELNGEWQEIKLIAKSEASDNLFRLAIHFSKDGNIGNPIYLDEFTGFIQPDKPVVIVPEIEFSQVTAESLKALSPDMPIGVAVAAGGFGNSLLNSPERQIVVEQHFSQLSAENIMKPTYFRPDSDTFFFDDADALVDYAKEHSMTVHGHVLVWHSQIANWMQSFEGDKAAWISMMEGHITGIASHFEEEGDTDTIISWDVVNEAFMENGSYRGEKTTTDSNDKSVWYENIGPEFLALSFSAARAADPDADLYYNDYNLIWNEDKLGAVINMVKQFQEDGVPIDGIGFQSHISVNSPNIDTIKKQLQKVVDIRPKIKVKITELDVGVNTIGALLDWLTYDRAELQKQYYHDVVKAYLDTVPADQRGGITVWGINDGDSWLPNFWNRLEWPLLFFNDNTPKPALQGFADALIKAQ